MDAVCEVALSGDGGALASVFRSVVAIDPRASTRLSLFTGSTQQISLLKMMMMKGWTNTLKSAARGTRIRSLGIGRCDM